LVNNVTITSQSVIGFSWSNGVSNGGSAIIDYRVWYDQSIGNFVVLSSSVLTTSYQTTVQLIPGRYYSFKVEARNSVGYSVISNAVVILAAQVPY